MHALVLESTASQWPKSRESRGPLVWLPVFNHHFRDQLPSGKTPALRVVLPDMGNFSFVVLPLRYLTCRQRQSSLSRSLQVMDHVMQELFGVCAALGRCGSGQALFLFAQSDFVCHIDASFSGRNTHRYKYIIYEISMF